MSLAELQAERQQYQEQLDIVAGQIKDDPDNKELASLKEELDQFVALLNDSIAELQPKQAPTPAAPNASTPQPAESEKWSRENHPAFSKAAPYAEEKDESPVSYQVNDTVLAKWLSGDKAFYPAKITSITGSSAAPIYVVKFKSYDNVETLRSKDIRPVSNKRKAEGPPAPVARPAPGVVSSAGAKSYPDAKKAAERDDVPQPPKPKKIKAKKELETNKNKWQEFNAKSKFGKTQKKDSMFRTPEGVHGRVGFTGSGQSMRKDPSRSRHVYQVNEDLD
ncbi:uncharacterized protein F5Z01DRAFT_280432 [Emericellopsis atlantica]|uniref:Tudor domain-containing protein n=1 Tax=Emericellopsis atlantica TaxID=2614577 RepID=A0A9P7ZGS3_9HYPO|nr:uncharacterized protein F5Z01DRAFT_280432 [Emericellopsis atlantica]KAG9251436.1 hypothetical protein F5Z01DRAFT_280432 [Emericellopsis atlantica]